MAPTLTPDYNVPPIPFVQTMVDILARIAYFCPSPKILSFLFFPCVFAVGKFVVVPKMWSNKQKITKTYEK